MHRGVRTHLREFRRPAFVPHRCEREHGRTGARRFVGGQRLLEALHGSRVQLRHSGFVHPDFDANLLHRRLVEVVTPDHALLARR
jgi:hypothetical protein